MTRLNKIICLGLLVGFLISCNKKYEGDSTFENVKYNTNRKAYPAEKMDSAQAVNSITKQKVQELFDLSTLYASGNRDTEIDSVIYAQMQSYFLKDDSNNVKPILKELDSLKVRFAKVNTLNSTKKITAKDTTNFATYDVDFFDKNRKLIGNFNKSAEYIFKKTPVIFKKEFRFYFVKFPSALPKDSTSTGRTR